MVVCSRTNIFIFFCRFRNGDLSISPSWLDKRFTSLLTTHRVFPMHKNRLETKNIWRGSKTTDGRKHPPLLYLDGVYMGNIYMYNDGVYGWYVYTCILMVYMGVIYMYIDCVYGDIYMYVDSVNGPMYMYVDGVIWVLCICMLMMYMGASHMHVDCVYGCYVHVY